MSSMHRIRAAAVGTKADMLRMMRVLLNNSGWLEEPEDRPPLSLREMRECLAANMEHDAGNSNAFFYEMLTPMALGESAGPGTLELVQLENDLWIAGFEYKSAEAPEAGDWLHFHKDCDRLPIFILHACEDFAREKGGISITNGEISENWDFMSEAWFWLVDEYGMGRDPQAALQHLRKLDDTLAREDWDQDADALIHSCILKLTETERACASITGELLQQAAENHEWERQLQMQSLLADSWLWETKHNAKWLASLQLWARLLEGLPEEEIPESI